MKILVVGLGSIAKKHIAVLKQLDKDLELFALRSVHSISSEEGVVNINSLEECNHIKLDFAIISNPTHLHKDAILKLIPLQIPLFIEKPLFDKLGNIELLDEIHSKKIRTYVACNLRFLDSIIWVKKKLVSKRINEVNVYCGSYLPDWRPGQDFRNIYSANKEMGGGVHIDLIHELDYIYWLFNKPDNVNFFGSNRSSLEISSIDYANYMLSYEDFNVNVILNYFRKDSKRSFEVVCEDGTFYTDLLKNNVFWNGEKIFESSQQIKDTYQTQMSFFLNEVLTGKEFNTISEAYEVLKICLERA